MMFGCIFGFWVDGMVDGAFWGHCFLGEVVLFAGMGRFGRF